MEIISGQQYERMCAKKLKKHGFSNIRVTKGSGDQGIDIIAHMNGKKYGIQCKYYSFPVGNHAVQEAYAGAKYHDCNVAVVMTNSSFTKSAIELAKKTDVLLWDNGHIPFKKKSINFRLWFYIIFILWTFDIIVNANKINNEVGIFKGILIYLSGIIIFCLPLYWKSRKKKNSRNIRNMDLYKKKREMYYIKKQIKSKCYIEKILNLYNKKWFSFLFPVPSVCFIVILGIALSQATTGETHINFFMWSLIMLFSLFLYVLPFDIIYWFIRGKKSYRKKIIKYVTPILNQVQYLAELINTTTDKSVFESSLVEIKEKLNELRKYENADIFKNSPSEDLENIIKNENLTRNKFYERVSNEAVFPDDSNNFEQKPFDMTVTNTKDGGGLPKKQLSKPSNSRSFSIEQYAMICNSYSEKQNRDDPIVYGEPDTHLFEDEAFESFNLSANFDLMNGAEFEHFCADLLRKNGFSRSEVISGSGDHGIDILAEKDGITYAIQCKCYSSNIGNAAVQQAHAGKSFYKKDIAVVLTNRHFTQQAKEEAETLGVKLWDRDKLNELIEKSNK